MHRAPVLNSSLAAALALAFVVATGCSSPSAPQFPARPPGCALETFKVLPQRPFVELETINLPSPETLAEVLDRVRSQACRDGADAIYAPKAGRSYTYVIALKWTDAPPPPAPPPPAPPPPAPGS